jgi:asparagine synthase (glutamine-hydrolysing)
MCGIAGFVGQHRIGMGEQAEVLGAMCLSLTHRGPDDQGTVLQEGMALGMRRLSIIDLAGGHQPLTNESGSIKLVFNGEIYNYRDLQRDLQSRGHSLRTNTDTEVIIHAYEEHGMNCVSHLRGMFAFALWDESRQRLFAARDRAGEKPLYYCLTATKGLVFASELKALLQHPEVPRRVDLAALDAYLCLGYIPDPSCILSGVFKLPPGHCLSYQDGEVRVQQYWDFPCEGPSDLSEMEYSEELARLLDEAVRLQIAADVPVGAFLSGGVDSSTVVAFMARHFGGRVKTFSIGFHEDQYSELSYARLAATHIGTEHHELVVTPDACQLAERIAWHADEPFADSSAIPTYLVSELARQHVTVALSGDGGDELFAGYSHYRTDRRRKAMERLPHIVRRGLLAPISRHLPHGAYGRNLLYSLSLEPLDRYIDSISVFSNLNRRSLYSEDLVQRLSGSGVVSGTLRKHAAHVTSGNALDRMLYVDSKVYLPADILTKVDRMSMAASLETRAPFLDHQLVEFAARVPSGLKLRGGQAKYILKRAVQDLLPPEILNRPKQGFAIPLQYWLRQQMRGEVQSILTERRTEDRSYFKPPYIRTLLDEHTRGRRDHSAGLWALLMLELWHRTFVDGTPTRAFPHRPPAPARSVLAARSAI